MWQGRLGAAVQYHERVRVIQRCMATSVRAKRPFLPRDVLIAGAARTPIGGFCGALAALPAKDLGSSAVGMALRRAKIEPEEVDAVFFGQALPAGCGQNAARQVAMHAGIPPVVDCTGINKACASGLKAVAVAAQAIALGMAEVAVAGGMESMSQVPYMLRQARTGGYYYGHGMLEDCVLQDGLCDALSQNHLGLFVERTAREMGISREEQDRHTIASYRRAANTWQRGAFDKEVAVVRVPNASGQRDSLEQKVLVVSVDEEYSRVDIKTVAALPPIFEEAGTITAASASSLNDGAAALVLVSAERARELGVQAAARIVAFADHGVEPGNFTVAPSGAVRRCLRAAGMSTVDFHEIHEAFAAVTLANMRLLDLDPSRTNINGGAVALGHPLGASGARILCTLLSVLEQQDAQTGCASIANGGGGATAMILERMG